MEQQLREWKRAIDRFWSVASSDYLDAARLAAEIAQESDEAALRQAAMQALPSLRNAVIRKASQGSKDLARRRLGIVRDILHALTAPQFGKRTSAPGSPKASPARSLTPEQRHRELLGLPLGRRLEGAEIHRAYKRAAKSAHPDVGGSGPAFFELSEARDALMKKMQ
jgi:hypothetical protein